MGILPMVPQSYFNLHHKWPTEFGCVQSCMNTSKQIKKLDIKIISLKKKKNI